ncbi:MAG: TIR domain-containing protein [Steroidobacteraceae bacterium]
MTGLDATDSLPPRPSIFLSYASEDREAARELNDALTDFGLEVWQDESALGGGEAWDQKIRRQIRECDYFMPIVSTQTQARHEGYFRREWRLAVERTLDMADDHLFLLPVVIDDTDQAAARVPEKFLTVQWLKVPGGRPTPALESLCHRVARGNIDESQHARTAEARPGNGKSAAYPLRYREFPREEPGQRIRFWVDVVVWAFCSAWMLFKRLPTWVRIIAYVWIGIALIIRCESSSPSHPHPHQHAAEISPAKIEKLEAISEEYRGSVNKNDIGKLATEIARYFPDENDRSASGGGPLLAVPFTASSGDAAAEKFADSTFAMAYGMASIAHQGQVSLTREPLRSRELGAALERGRASHSTYVLYGTVDSIDHAQVLTVTIATVADGSVVWSKYYPVADADPTSIASEVVTKIPANAAK